jgi:general secretion pathway protein E
LENAKVDDNKQNENKEEVKEVTGMEIEIKISLEEDIKVAIERFYGAGSHSMSGIIEDMDEEEIDMLEREGDDIEHLKDLASEAPIIKLVNLLITRAIEIGASDIHIEPFEGEIITRYRVDGVLHNAEAPPKRLQAALISRLKIMAKLNIAERRLPQDGRIKFSVVGKEVDMRVSTLPTIHGESIVLRILDRESGHHSLDKIGFPENSLKQFENLILKPYGMLLVTGPTGSGKTTTLYSAMAKINKPGIKIVTIEDPVEYQMRGINQIHVNSQIGMTFANGLRSIVRQDPDVIMVGEIRDGETAEIAIQSALTGHMVFSTVHTNDAAGAIVRLQDMGIEPFLLSSALLGVLAQRLVRVICSNCKTIDTVTEESVKKLRLLNEKIPDRVWIGEGCDKCNYTGYKGRSGIFELLIINEEIKNMILSKRSSNLIKECARKSGMTTLREDGWIKVLQGITSIDELLRVTIEEHH